MDETEEGVLSLGLNYATALRDLPVDEVIARTEALAKHLDAATAAELKHITRQCLAEANPPGPNLTKEQSRALGHLRKDKSIVILPADKGNARVILDAPDYQKID